MQFVRLALLIGLSGTAAMAAEGRNFTIAGESFPEAEIVDARAQPELDGTSSIRITFSASAAKRIAVMTQKLVGKPAHVSLDERPVAAPVVRKPIRDGVLQLSGAWTVKDAEALARKISGKGPLPDSLAE
jgi:preprotein translocase subunit SecD